MHQIANAQYITMRLDYRSLSFRVVPLSLRHHLSTIEAPSKQDERGTITHLEQNVLVNSTREVENASPSIDPGQ